MTQAKQPKTARDSKSRMFTMIFNNKESLLELYNAVSQKHYEDPELLTINTLENAIYMSMKNDLSFLIDSRLSLYEHQSTRNPNMPLRFLFYLSDLYSAMVNNKNLYGTKTIPIPAPRFLVFYNGTAKQPDHEMLYLSDAYMTKEEETSLELKVDILNINFGHNNELLESCKTLKDYSEYVYRMRRYAKNMPIKDAVERTVEECIREGILQEFLTKNKAEAINMSIYEYNEEEHIRMEREDAYEKGRADEQANTKRECQRADAAEQRANAAESEIRRLKEFLKKHNL